jgi:hypothetical protein
VALRGRAQSGRLAHLLNATGLLPPPGVVATDLDPAGGDVVPALREASFPVTVADDTAALRSLRPLLVLCAWMEFGTDLTPSWRRAHVPECAHHLSPPLTTSHHLSPPLTTT